MFYNYIYVIVKWLQRVTSEEPLQYKELQSYRGFLNYVFKTYTSFRSFMKFMHLNLEYWYPHRDSEVWKQDAYGLDGDLVVENFGGEAE